jgi:hypothetical protein
MITKIKIKNELMKNTKTNAVSYEIFIAFARKYLADKFVFFNNIKQQSQQTPIPPNPFNPIFPQQPPDDGNAEMKMDVDEGDLPTNNTKEKTKREDKPFVSFKKQKAIELKTNRNIGMMGRNNQNSRLPETVEKSSIPQEEGVENNRSTKRKAVNQNDKERPNKKQDTRPLTGPFSNPNDEQRGFYTNNKRKVDSQNNTERPNKKQDTKTLIGPFSNPNENTQTNNDNSTTNINNLKKLLLMFFKKNPTRISEFFPFSTNLSYNEIKSSIQNLDAQTTQIIYKRVVEKYPRIPLPSTGTGLQPPFTLNEMMENTELTDFEKLKNILTFYPNFRNLILSPHNPNSNWTYPQTVSLMISFMASA